MRTVLITGGTGMIGKAITKALLAKNYHVIILSRSATKKVATDRISFALWDPKTRTIDKVAIARADHLIHLAGAGIVDKRWTKKRKQEIVESRVGSSELLVSSLKEIPNNVRSVVTASAIGWYGPDPVIPNPHPFTEEDPPKGGFLADTCKSWEQSIEPVVALGKRLVKLRTGIVLSKDGGALKEFEKSLKFGVAAILGSGRQIVSWIHIDDLVNLYIKAIEDENMNGVYNAVAPIPVSNKHLVTQLAKARKGAYFIPIYVPAFVLQVVLGEMSIEALKSTTVSSGKIQLSGFEFIYPSLDDAFRQLLGRDI